MTQADVIDADKKFLARVTLEWAMGDEGIALDMVAAHRIASRNAALEEAWAAVEMAMCNETQASRKRVRDAIRALMTKEPK